jgi:hypothetical protein
VRSGPGAARTILLFHIISDRPSKQTRVTRMVRTFLKVHTRLGLACALQCGEEVTESSTNKQHISSPIRSLIPVCVYVFLLHINVHILCLLHICT